MQTIAPDPFDVRYTWVGVESYHERRDLWYQCLYVRSHRNSFAQALSKGFEPLHALVLERECFVRALCTSPSHSSGRIFGRLLEHYSDVLDPTDPVGGFDHMF